MKSMKKLVLAGLVLLASVMVLVGCKMEPEGPQGQKVYKFTSEPRILSDYKSPNNTDSEWTYVAFGDWPQTIKDKDVIVDETKGLQMGMFTYYLGSDGNYYVKVTAQPLLNSYKYSDETDVIKDEEGYFKVEPIVWRVLTDDYKVPGEDGELQSTGQALLLAENILTGGVKWDSYNNYKKSNIRKWLNGNSGSEEVSDYNGDAGFLQTAFTKTARDQIADTKVDNSATSTLPNELGFVQKKDYWNDGVNQNACENTTDKIFLLSEQEATKKEYGFAWYDVCVADERGTKTSTRIRVTTDYAKATGASQANGNVLGGLWWLRSPYYDKYYARRINQLGNADDYTFSQYLEMGVVPALSISLQ